MSTNNEHPSTHANVDELIQQLLDGEVDDIDALLSNLDDDTLTRQAADLQLVHSMLMHLHEAQTDRCA